FAFSSDSANYTNLFEHVFIADTVHVADTVGSEVQSALGNWSISGDVGIISTDFVGTNDNIKFQLGTNNITRMVFDNDHVYNSLFASGFGWNANNGFLVQPGGTSTIQSIAGSYLFFGGSKRAFSGGETILGLDTLLGDYSFTWGKNVGSNGPYSTLFGNNSHGDSTAFSSGSPAVSGFSVGKDNSVSYVGVAIGENCQANFYRNVAIGWNCIA